MRFATSFTSSLQRLWQPRKPLFWLVVVFNGLSSAMTLVLHLAQPEGFVLVLLTLLALSNTGMGWWLLWRLWSETENPRPVDDPGHGPQI